MLTIMDGNHSIVTVCSVVSIANHLCVSRIPVTGMAQTGTETARVSAAGMAQTGTETARVSAAGTDTDRPRARQGERCRYRHKQA